MYPALTFNLFVNTFPRLPKQLTNWLNMLPTLIPVKIKEIKGPFLFFCSVWYIFKVFDVSDKVFIRFLKHLENGSRDNF